VNSEIVRYEMGILGRYDLRKNFEAVVTLLDGQCGIVCGIAGESWSRMKELTPIVGGRNDAAPRGLSRLNSLEGSGIPNVSIGGCSNRCRVVALVDPQA
jgi:hypothetical protein